MAKKPAKKKRSIIKKAAWTEFSMYIRVRDAIRTTGGIHSFNCISCGRRVPVKGNDAGHFVSGRHDAVLFHEEVVHGQCAHCNRFKEGEYIPYERAMRELYGTEKVEELKLLKWAIRKYTTQELIDLKLHYRQKLKDLVERWERGDVI